MSLIFINFLMRSPYVPAHFQQMLEEIKRGMVKPVTETSAYLEKRNPAKRQARFYTLRVVPTLFGDRTLVREWGRIGSPGRLTIDWFDTLEEAQSAFDRIKRRKIGRGYRGLSFVRGQRD